jgi:hypothetical protein
MNLIHIDKEFKRLDKIEVYINQKFEPRSKGKHDVKKHIYYDDLEADFVAEVNAYGFSPYIQQSSDLQRRDKDIMRYKTNFINDGLINYVKKRNKDSKGVVNYKLNEGPLTAIRRKSGLKSAMLRSSVESQRAKTGKSQPTPNEETKNNFLQKALEDLARNKMNNDDEYNFLNEIKKEKQLEKNKDRDSIKLKKDNSQKNFRNTIQVLNEENKENEKSLKKLSFINSLKYKVRNNPMISLSNFSQPDPQKLNYERFFNNAHLIRAKTPSDTRSEFKKLVGLMKNKEVLKSLRKVREDKGINRKSMLTQNDNEVDRDNVNVNPSFKVFNQRSSKMSVFKKLYRQSMIKNNVFGIGELLNKNKSEKKIEKKASVISVKNSGPIFYKDKNKNYEIDEGVFKIIDASPYNLILKATKHT